MRLEGTLIRWITPGEFYVQLQSHANDFEKMSDAMQIFYERLALKANSGFVDDIVVVFDKERLKYVRGQIVRFDLECKPMAHIIKLLDYGNEIICHDYEMILLDKSFRTLPAIAIQCSMHGVVMNFDREDTKARMKHFINVDALEKIECTFVKRNDTFIFVEIFAKDGTNVKDSLISDNVLSKIPTGKLFQLC